MAEARFADADALLDTGLALARRRGDRLGERQQLAQRTFLELCLGRWDELIELVAGLREHGEDLWTVQATLALPHVLVARGETAGLLAMPTRSAVPRVAESSRAWHYLRADHRARDS